MSGRLFFCAYVQWAHALEMADILSVLHKCATKIAQKCVKIVYTSQRVLEFF